MPEFLQIIKKTKIKMEETNMKKLLCLALAAVMVLSMCACSSDKGGDADGDGYKDEIIFCQGSDLTTLDPTYSSQERLNLL